MSHISAELLSLIILKRFLPQQNTNVNDIATIYAVKFAKKNILLVFSVASNQRMSTAAGLTTQTCSNRLEFCWSTFQICQRETLVLNEEFFSVLPHRRSLLLSHERDQRCSGERQRGSGGAEGGNGEAQLQPEPGPDQHPAHAQRPGLPRRGVGRHLRPAVPQHPPVAVAAAHQRQLHQGEGGEHTFLIHSQADENCVQTPAGFSPLAGHLKGSDGMVVN